jgi:hypothetical protein
LITPTPLRCLSTVLQFLRFRHADAADIADDAIDSFFLSPPPAIRHADYAIELASTAITSSLDARRHYAANISRRRRWTCRRFISLTPQLSRHII